MKFGMIFIICVLAALVSFAQQDKAAARYEIDAKRIGVNLTDKDALPRSREFLRLDSTYYVGWMYEGMYKYDRSADYLGYKNAIIPLGKAKRLLEKDFGQTLKNMYSSIAFYSQNVARYQDYVNISNALKECYDNLEMPDSVMALLDDIESYRFQKDFFGVYFQRAWEYHRNRFFTTAKYDFLKNTVKENERAALQSCYQGFAFIDKNKAQNDAWYGPNQATGDRLRIYHYLALLHGYNKNYDSCEYYYDQLINYGMVLWSNYANFETEVGRFASATQNYSKDLFSAGHYLREAYYYLPQLYIYAGDTKKAISTSQEIIAGNGSTPGFGWYNIALARGYMYDGQLDSAVFALDKAANFKELHIGTTLSQSQYDFTINLLKVQLVDRQIAQVKFVNRGWWYSLKSLFTIASLKLQKIMAEYVVANELANDPDRTRLVYDLFCGESTTTYDEAWYLLKDFSPVYFKNKYQEYQRTDPRQNIQRYFKLFDAQFKWEDGDKNEARKDFENLQANTLLDTAHEKLFTGRLMQNLMIANKGSDNSDSYNFYRNMLTEQFPQLAPFSGIKMPMQLTVTGENDANTSDVIGDLKDCNIDFDSKTSSASANIQFTKKGDKYEAVINVKSAYGKPIVTNQRLVFKNSKGVGAELGLRLFGKGGAVVFDPGS